MYDEMDSTFSTIAVKQEPVSYASSLMVDGGLGIGETSEGNYGNRYDHDGNQSSDYSTLDLHDRESDGGESITDNVAYASNPITEYTDDLFKYDEESDLEDGSSEPMPHPKDGNNVKRLQWTKRLSTTKIKPFHSAVLGPNLASCKASGAPVDYFHQFFPEELYKEAQTETNNYAEYYQEKRRDLGRDWWEWTDSEWEPVESKWDIMVFIGICIVMGVHSMPNPRDYWSKQRNVCNRLITRSSMNMCRFDRIMHYFYLGNPWRDPEKIVNLERRVEACNRDPLYKVSKGLHEHVKNTCITMYQPHQDIVMQELAGTVIGVNRTSDMKTNGWKLLALKDAHTGYVSNFQWYHDPKVTSKYINHSMTQESAVTSLINSLAGKGHFLYADGVHISPAVACQFTNLDTYVICNHSDWPNEIASSNPYPEVGHTMSVQCNGVTATVWQGKGVKRCLSTMHDGLMQPVTLKLRDPTTREHTIKEVLCPTAIAKHTAVLDKLPQRLLLSQAPVLQKLTNSWWKRLVWLLIDICINNAYVMWTASKGHHLSYTEFAMEVASKLISDPWEEQCSQGTEERIMAATSQQVANTQVPNNEQQQPIMPYSIQPAFQLPVIHHSPFPEANTIQAQPDPSLANHQIDESDSVALEHCLVKFPGRGRNCRQCTADKNRTRCGRRRDTQFGCLACGLNLCRSGCFLRFHESHGLNVTAASMAEIKLLPDQPPPLKKQKHRF